MKGYRSVVEVCTKRSRKYKVAAAAAKLEEGTLSEKQGLIDPDDMTKIPFRKALIEGYLTNDEYCLIIMLVSVLVLIFITGQIIAGTTNPQWMGQLVWTMSYVLLFTVIPIIKWFNTYTIDR